MLRAGSELTVKRNADYPWDEFNSEDYFVHNYASMRDDDQQILSIIRDFFADRLAGVSPGSLRGIDVGTGSNLYPALAMLPFCKQITLYEHSVRNIKWLLEGQENDWASSWPGAWARFWELYAKHPVYADVEHPRAALANRCEVAQGSVFELEPPAEGPWDVGTMFFVAESITQSREEFNTALGCFLGSLAPGAPFAIALMEHSLGYHVADLDFPATNVGDNDVAESLREWSSTVSIKHVDTGNKPLRDGYSGMIVVCGTRDLP
jgi:NNMT/PNMT/TEMT family